MSVNPPARPDLTPPSHLPLDRADSLDLLPVALVRQDGDRITLNRAAERLIGRPRGDVTRLDQWFEATAGKRSEDARRLFELDAAVGSREPRLVPVERADGTIRMLEQTTYDHSAARLWFLNDVSDQLEAEAALRDNETTTRRAIEGLPSIAFQLRVGTDGHRRLVFVSERIHELHGWPAAALCAEPDRVFDAVAQVDRNRVRARIEVAFRRELPLTCDYRIALGPSMRWLRLTARPNRQADGAVIWDGLVSNIDDLRRAADEARAANRAKSEFLSRMSHELRTPLNAVLGFTQLLDRLETDERQRRYIGYIEQAGQHLLKLINEVLELSKIEAGAMTIDLGPVDLAQILAEVVTLMAPAAARNGIALSMPTGTLPVVRADRIRVKQVLLNFVSNAIKYNRPNGKVTLTIVSAPDGMCRIAVRDTGPGIPEDRQKNLFTAFDRLGAEETNIEGSGIGLVISKRLIDLMHGAIGFDTSPDGSTFWVDLPVVRSGQTGTTTEERRRAPRQTARKLLNVLYIEHSADEIRLMRELLQEAPHVALITAPHIDVATEVGGGRRFDLVIANIDAPHPDAEALLRRLARREETANLPVIAISSNRQTLHHLPTGVEGFVRPIRIGGLLARIEALIAAHAEAEDRP